MEAVDITDEADATLSASSVTTSAECVGAGRSADTAKAAGSQETADNNADSADVAKAKYEDFTGWAGIVEVTDPASTNIADGEEDVGNVDSAVSADAGVGEDSADITNSGSRDGMDQSPKGDAAERESDSDGTNEETCLEAMTPDGQDYYLRLGDTPRRRSALRLSRIIARKQLVHRLAQGRNGGKGKVRTGFVSGVLSGGI